MADMLLDLFWTDGPPDHLADGAGGTLLHAPYCRLGHPADSFRLDLRNTSGTVIGVIRRARFEGQQLRGDVVLLDHPPIHDWPYVRAAILTMAAERPTEFGLSICSTGTICSTCPSDGGLAAAIDLVSRPAANRNGLLGLPTNGLATHPQPAVREIGRRRTYWPEVVYEALIESWITGEPV